MRWTSAGRSRSTSTSEPHDPATADLAALADLVARVSHVAAAHPELGELELNPVLASASGALALDARAVLTGASATSRG